MRRVQFSEAEQDFAQLISEAEAGESLTILRGNKPIAQIIPFPVQAADTFDAEAERQAAARRLAAITERGYDLGIVWNGRDELYDRD